MSGTPGVVDGVNQRKNTGTTLHSIRNARNVEGHINHRTCVPPKMKNDTSVLERDIMSQCATAGLESLLNIKPGLTEMSVTM